MTKLGCDVIEDDEAVGAASWGRLSRINVERVLLLVRETVNSGCAIS